MFKDTEVSPSDSVALRGGVGPYSNIQQECRARFTVLWVRIVDPNATGRVQDA